ncbi:hypothetical protein R3P38DRAFT_3228189 [Favolaschia claudopus]|uniref:F-box domain-containing protein n=1 Tax=Favolaschia claudopus TaxID=2862362 RepID=A0AAV9ZR25_9AGAR
MDLIFQAAAIDPVAPGSAILRKILSFCAWNDLLAAQRVSRGMRDHVLLMFFDRYREAVERFLPADVATFSAMLVAAKGAIGGSVAYTFPHPISLPSGSDLNVLVPTGGSANFFIFLDGQEWFAWRENIPGVVHFCFQKIVAGEIRTITVTETPDVVEHVFRSKHSQAMSLLTPTSFTFFHKPSRHSYVRATAANDAYIHKLAVRGLKGHVLPNYNIEEHMIRPRLRAGIQWAAAACFQGLRDHYADDLNRCKDDTIWGAYDSECKVLLN